MEAIPWELVQKMCKNVTQTATGDTHCNRTVIQYFDLSKSTLTYVSHNMSSKWERKSLFDSEVTIEMQFFIISNSLEKRKQWLGRQNGTCLNRDVILPLQQNTLSAFQK